MTVSSSINRVTYAGNGATTNFAVNFYFLETAHLQVIIVDANGVETVQTLTSNYTVTGAGNPAGGSVSMVVPPPAGTQLIIVRNVPATQETDYLANDPFPAESHERALDKLTMLVQQNKLASDRALKIPLASLSATSTELPNPVPLGILAWNQTSTAINYVNPQDLVTVAISGNFYIDTFVGDGTQVNFILSQNPVALNNLNVAIQGVTQTPTDNYLLSGTTLTFVEAPPINTKICVKYTIFSSV